jgi:hypothetical protein
MTPIALVFLYVGARDEWNYIYSGETFVGRIVCFRKYEGVVIGGDCWWWIRSWLS